MSAPLEVSFYPGCSLATTAKESMHAMQRACGVLGVELVELQDWNCCGSSSAHALDRELALELAGRNLALAPAGRPLMVACPSCFKNLKSASLELAERPGKRAELEGRLGRAIDSGLAIVSFLEIIHFLDRLGEMDPARQAPATAGLAGLKAAPYYGCMLAEPKRLRGAWRSVGLMEKSLKRMGAGVTSWRYRDRCCGTFLAAARPEAVTPLIDRIVDDAKRSGADCIVTACAMCQLNLEIRCTLADPLPVLHFSEALALGLAGIWEKGWSQRHLKDPAPLLQRRGLLPA